jgi:L-alanine-DL-glutamate epimerase-like enolase superfamily enzyme
VRIEHVSVAQACAPLSKPYELSFATLNAFDSVTVAISRADAKTGIGEAVALPGYGWETTASILQGVRQLLYDAVGADVQSLARRAHAVWKEQPFAASAVMTALELPDWLHHAESGLKFPLNAAVASTSSLDELWSAASRVVSNGYRYLKLKIGRNVTADILSCEFLLNRASDCGFKLVVDANQGYCFADAERFARAAADMNLAHLLWLEQPLDRTDWPGMDRLCSLRLVPIVFDESIYDENDILRAAGAGAHGVKLKLFKNFGLAETSRLARKAKEHGLKVVFGNGVATDLGNFGEYLVLAASPELFSAPSESSGFAKLRSPRSSLGLAIADGLMTCDGNVVRRQYNRVAAELSGRVGHLV